MNAFERDASGRRILWRDVQADLAAGLAHFWNQPGRVRPADSWEWRVTAHDPGTKRKAAR